MRARRPLTSVLIALLSAGALAAGPRFDALHGEATGRWVLGEMEVRDPDGESEGWIRLGHIPASPEAPFRGSVLYLEGFADSLANHDPLFTRLADAGYRVVAFDYLGQGGSTGSMNAMRMDRILALADRVWERRARREAGDHGKVFLGWSTGGLAAYQAGVERRVDAIVMLAPGVHVRTVVGRFGRVTLDTLTSRTWPDGADPHVDPIRPASPMRVPLFAADLLRTAYASQRWSLPADVPALALISGPLDRYVRARRTAETLRARSPHVEVREFPDALHELDNEVEEIAAPVRDALLEFLAGLPPR